MTITIEPLGGLGNQLFVYAVGLALAKRQETTLEADLWRFHKYPWHNYELDSFRTEISRTYSSKVRCSIGHQVRWLPQTAANFGFRSVLPMGRLVTEIGNRFDPGILGITRHCRLAGYFQSWRYFETVVDQIRENLLLPTNESEWMRRTSKELEALGAWTCIHVRLGNYSKIKGMGLVENGYYDRSLSLINTIFDDLPVVVFSDSPLLVRQMPFFDQKRFLLIVTPSESRPIETLILMSRARAKIIGNSTFSWWAAFLGDSQDGVVVAPRPWLDTTTYDDRDLLPLNWLTVGRLPDPGDSA